MKYGTETRSSWLMNCLVGTLKTSVGEELVEGAIYYMCVCGLINLRSISSRVSCLVSLTKQKIMNQAMRLSPA